MNTPGISIIIPAYNIGQFIGRCLESCVNQTFRDIEIVVVDDGSIDTTSQIIEKYLRQDSRIVCVAKENEGVNFARKTGVNLAKGQYIFYLDGDDTIPPQAMQVLYDAALLHDADIVAGNVEVYSLKHSFSVKHYDKFIEGNGIQFLEFILNQNLHYLWGKLIRHSLYTENNIIFRKEVKIGEDQVQLLQICMFANKVITVHETVYHYIKQPESATQRNDIIQFTQNQVNYILSINELQKKISYNNYIQQQLNLRIIYSFHQIAGNKIYSNRIVRKIVYNSIKEGILKKPSLLKGYKSHILKGMICLFIPRAFNYTKRMYHTLILDIK